MKDAQKEEHKGLCTKKEMCNVQVYNKFQLAYFNFWASN